MNYSGYCSECGMAHNNVNQCPVTGNLPVDLRKYEEKLTKEKLKIKQTWCAKCRTHHDSTKLTKWDGMTLPLCRYCRVSVRRKK